MTKRIYWSIRNYFNWLVKEWNLTNSFAISMKEGIAIRIIYWNVGFYFFVIFAKSCCYFIEFKKFGDKFVVQEEINIP